MAEELNPLTGLPYDGAATIDTTSGEAKEINPLTKEAYAEPPKITLGSSTGYDQSVLMSTDYLDKTRDIDKFAKYNVPRGQLLDWEEIRAMNQSTADKWGNGIAKAGVTTIGAVAENTLGIIFGLGELAFGSGDYYDNTIGKTVDKTNEWMRENMPNYLTSEEQNMSTFEKLGTANFWADTVANGLGYSIGSIATMYVTGGLGPISGLARAGKAALGASRTAALYNASKAIVNGTKLGTQLAKGASFGAKFARHGQVLETGLMMSLAEGSVEARETKNTVRENLISAYVERNGLDSKSDIPAAELKAIEETASAAGNANFAANLAVLTPTNLLMFGRGMTGYKAAMKANRDVVYDAAAKKAVSKFANNKTWQNVLERMKAVGKNGVEESIQEGSQFLSGQTSESYFTERHTNNGHGDMAGSLSDAWSKTIGSQEGLESMLVGFITGSIMGGGQSIVNKEYSSRVKNAQMIADVINGGFLDNSKNQVINASAMSAATKQMQAALESGDIKAYKDAQYKLLSYNALAALENGSFDVFIEKYEDTKSLDDAEFAKLFNITDKDGNALDLEKTLDKTKNKIVDDHIKKLRNFESVYNNVTDRFALPERVTGLPRLLQNKEARETADKVYNDRKVLQTMLILNGAEVASKTQRMFDMEAKMKEIVDKNSLAGVAGINIDMESVLQDFSKSRKDPGTRDAAEEGKDFDGTKRETELRERFVQAYRSLQTVDPLAAQEFGELVKDYVSLSSEINQALDSYNKLASDPYAQAAFVKETEAKEKAKIAAEQTKAANEAIEKAETAEEITDQLPNLKEGTPERAAAVKKAKELQKKQDAKRAKYLKIGNSLQETLDKLESIDTKDMSSLEIAALKDAIGITKKRLEAAKNGDLEVTPPTEEPSQPDGPLKDDTQEAYKDNPVDGYTEDGRTFQINGATYYNNFPDPLDAIKRDYDTDEVFAVVLEDEDGNTHTFRAPEALVDMIAWNIIQGELVRMEGQPTLEDKNSQFYDDVNDAIKKKNEKILKNRPVDETDSSLRLEIYSLKIDQRAAIENRDMYRAALYAAGATKEDLKNDPQLKEYSKTIRSLGQQIASRKRILKLRAQDLALTTDEFIMAQGQAADKVKEAQELANLVDNQIKEAEEKIEFLKSERQRYIEGRDMDSAEAAAYDLKKETERLQELQADKREAAALLKLEQNNLNSLTNEKDDQSTEDGQQDEQPAAPTVEQQESERQDQDRVESTEEERASIAEQREEALNSIIGITKISNGKETTVYQIQKPIKGERPAGLKDYPTEQEIIDEINKFYDNKLADLEGTEESAGTDEQLVEKQVVDKKEIDDASKPVVSSGPASTGFITGKEAEDLIGPAPAPEMPPITENEPTFGESLYQAAVPPEEGTTPGESVSIPMKAAFSDPSANNPANNKSYIEVVDGSPRSVGDELENRQMLDTLQVGDVVEFEIIENDFFVENHKGKPTEMEYLPIYYKKDGVIVGKLQRSTSQEKIDLVNKLREGKKVTSTISEIIAPNFNNAKTREGTPYYYDPRESLGDNPTLVFSTVTDGEFQQFTTGQEGAGFIDLSDKDASNVYPGAVLFYVPSSQRPGSEHTVALASTANLNQDAQDAVIEALQNKDVNRASQIVANSTSIELEGQKLAPTFLHFGEFNNETGPYLVYRSPVNRSERLVQISLDDFNKAMLGKPFRIGFVELDGENFVPVKNVKAEEHDFMRENFVSDFKNFLKAKKYHVDRELGNSTEPYSSPVYPNNTYSTYKEYLFSAQEIGQARPGGNGYNAILTTDLVRTSSGLFHNPVISFSAEKTDTLNYKDVAERVKFASTETSQAMQGMIDEMGISPFADQTPREDFNNDCKI